MRHLLVIAVTAMASFSGIVVAQDKSVDSQIAEALSPLPESARADATVITYDAKGDVQVIRPGTNGIICAPSQNFPNIPPSFAVYCYGKAFAPQHDFIIKQLAQGKTHAEAVDAFEAAVKSGKLQRPPAGTMTYLKVGKDAGSAKILWRLLVPNATAESLGLPTKPAQGAPWMMLSGTPNAHVMIEPTDAALTTADSKKSETQ